MDEKVNRNVLVVDDDTEVLASVSLLLKKEGYSVTACSDVYEALTMVRGNNFDVVLSDIKMPRLSGMELLEKIRDINPQVPVVLMTAYADLDIAVNAISKGAFDFLMKPSPPDYLLHSIKKAFQHKSYLNLKENYKLYLEDMVRQRTKALESEISERRQAEEALRLSEQRLRELASRLQKVEQTERKELARELHDRVGQNLTALSINFNIIQNQLSAEALGKVGERLNDSMSLVEGIAGQIRGVIDDLRPDVLDDYGLVPALRWYGDRFAKRTGVAVKIHNNEAPLRLSEEVVSAIFDISKEALNNVAKHAEAREVVLTLETKERSASLTINDDGKGFDMSALQKPERNHGWGLLIMQERAQSAGGRFSVESGPGKGTKIVVEIKV